MFLQCCSLIEVCLLFAFVSCVSSSALTTFFAVLPFRSFSLLLSSSLTLQVIQNNDLEPASFKSHICKIICHPSPHWSLPSPHLQDKLQTQDPQTAITIINMFFPYWIIFDHETIIFYEMFFTSTEKITWL